MDLTRCLEILRTRGRCDHEHEVHHAQEGPAAGEEEVCGQVIDLIGDFSGSESRPVEGASSTQSEGAGETLPSKDSSQRSVEKLAEGMANMNVKELVQAFRKAQEDRVFAYREFDESLSRVLLNCQLDEYTGACAEATATFAALSNLVNAVEASLKGVRHANEPGVETVANIVRKVQAEEKEKLQLTAALHLEKIRLSQGGGQTSLLAGGVKRLEGKLSEVKGRINELLEDLICEMEDM